MGILNINHIQEGMELAEDLVNFNGTVLLTVGSMITDRHLGAFRMWGITEANIKGVEDGCLEEIPLENIDPGVIENLETEMERRFRKTNRDDPVTAELYRLVKKRKLKDVTDERAR